MSEPIRVLQVFAEMNRGGAETMIMNLYRNIDRTKIQFDFIVHTEEECDYDEEIRKLGGKIFTVPRYTGRNHFQYRKAWMKFFNDYPEYRVIHGHVRSTASIFLKTAKKYGLITIAHSHSTSSGTGLRSIIKNILQFPIRNVADYLLACSQSAGEWLYGKKACQKEQFYIFKNAINTNDFRYNKTIRVKKRKEFQIEDKYVIGHVGRFHSAKNHEFLIDIFKAVYDKNENALLMLVGDGELRESIEEKVNHLGLSKNVIFTGMRSDIPDLLQAMDIFVFPSLYEGLGLVLIEAQAAGLPCLVSETIPDEAIITDYVRRIQLSENPNIWANQILDFTLYKREDNSKQIINSGYDIESTSEWLMNFYLESHYNN